MDDSHLFYFTAKSLSYLLAAEGFRVLRVEEGLRPYRFSWDWARSLPLWALYSFQKATSLLQIKTGLSVVARLS